MKISAARGPAGRWGLPIHGLLLGIGMTGAALLLAAPALAQSEAPWRVSGKLLGQPKGADGQDARKAEDISGIACATGSGFPRLCMIVDDESQGAQVVILKDGSLIAGNNSFIRLIRDSHDGKLLELDAEGVAYSESEGAFYVIGSHGRPRHEQGNAADQAKSAARAAASQHLFRIRIAPGSVNMDTGERSGTPEIEPASLTPFMQADAGIAPWLDKPLEDNGLTVEGVAVLDGRLHVGMRGPVLDGGKAAILVLPVTAAFGGPAATAKAELVQLGQDSFGKARGIRDLLAFHDRLLILAGPQLDPPKGHNIKMGEYSVYSWQAGGEAKKLADLPGFGAEVKPEAMLPLAETNGTLKALLFFDGPDEGAPRTVQFPLN
jgi:hypothetical protein